MRKPAKTIAAAAICRIAKGIECFSSFSRTSISLPSLKSTATQASNWSNLSIPINIHYFSGMRLPFKEAT